MRLNEAAAIDRLHANTHGVLATLHPERGIDMTPIVYAAEGKLLGSPIDRVKPKASLRLQREHNLEADARATLLVEHWDPVDWSKLWWVRAELRWLGDDSPHAEAFSDRLASNFEQYRDAPFASILMFEIVRTTGWAAS
jgi:hypothetical protein